MTNEQAIKILRRAEPTRDVLVLLRDIRDRMEPEAECPSDYQTQLVRMGLVKGGMVL